MKKITFIIRDTDGTYAAQNGWHWLGMWTMGSNVRIWKTFKGVLGAVRRDYPNNMVVVIDRVPGKFN